VGREARGGRGGGGGHGLQRGVPDAVDAGARPERLRGPHPGRRPLLVVRRGDAGWLLPLIAALFGFGAGATVAPGLFQAALSMPSRQLGPAFALVELLRSEAAFLIAPLLLHVAEADGTSPHALTTGVHGAAARGHVARRPRHLARTAPGRWPPPPAPAPRAVGRGGRAGDRVGARRGRRAAVSGAGWPVGGVGVRGGRLDACAPAALTVTAGFRT